MREAVRFEGRVLRTAWLALVAGATALGCDSGSKETTGSATSSPTTTGTQNTGSGTTTTSTTAGAGGNGAGGSGAGSNGTTGAVATSAAGAAGAAETSTTGVIQPEGYEVLVDPYGNCPLVAVVNLHDLEPNDVQTLRVVVSGQNGAPDFTREYVPTDTEFVEQWDTSDLTFSKSGTPVPVLGLYADTENSVQIVVDRIDGSREEFNVSIETLLSRPEEAAWVPTIQVDAALVESMEPGWTLAELNIEPDPAPPIVFVDWTRTIAFDERGAIRWVLRPELPKGETFTVTRSLSGNLLTGSFDTIVEVTKLGRTLRSFQLSDHSLNHEIMQIGSDDPAHASPGDASEHLGNLLVLASKNGASSIQDHILELDEETGELLNEWDLATVFDRTRTTYVDPERWSPGVGDWLHTNGLAYSNADESIIVSGRHQGVAKIRRDGTLVWLLAPHEGWQEPQSQKLLTAVDASLTPYEEAVQLGNEAAGDPMAPEFGWAFGQHSPALLPNGDLLLFDNGSSRHWGPVCGSLSRAVVYRIDEAAMTVRQMGQFILSKPESSCFVSNTHLLPTTGNLFLQPGSAYFDTGSAIAVVKEVATQIDDDGVISFSDVVFSATVDMSVIPRGSFAYSYRGHRWTF